jgi:2'-5' RNA ligase
MCLNNKNIAFNLKIMRLFVAIATPQEITQELDKLQKGLIFPQKPPSHLEQSGWDPNKEVLIARRSPWRAANPSQLHITLQFLGDDINLHQKEKVKEALMPICKKHKPVEIKPAFIGAFPSLNHARVIWAGVEGVGLNSLADEIEKALKPIGITRDKPFSPHITIARTKIAQDVSGMLKPYLSKPWGSKGWVAQEFILFESKLGLGGHEHEIVQAYKLEGKDEG